MADKRQRRSQFSPQRPQALGLPEQEGASSWPPPAEANTESFLESLTDRQCGQRVPFQSELRTRTSESLSQASQ